MKWIVRLVAGRHRGALPAKIVRIVRTVAIAKHELILGLKVRDISNNFVNQGLEAPD